VTDPFTDKAGFDFELFKSHVHKAMRIMDDIIDLELEKIDAILSKIENDPESAEVKRVEILLWEKIKQKAVGGRRTGLGITGEGDMIAALGLQYGTDEATDFAVSVQKTLALESYRQSVNLAKERGMFPLFDAGREKDNPMIKRIAEADPELYEEMKICGRRNISMLTIAPTGTTSIMTQTTSGIEPVFLPVYKRRRKVNPNDKGVNISFKDENGDSYEEYFLFHHKFIKWAKINGLDIDEVKKLSGEQIEKLVALSPYSKATSADIDWVSKVKMQGKMQKWVDHSISVTVNLPEDITEDLVAEVYRTAWESGCKGITVYREGSRSGILVPNKSAEESAFPKKRPESLDAEVVRFKNKNEQWIAFVGLYNGRPYEIFTGLIDEDVRVLPKGVTMGKIIKEKIDGNSVYHFQWIDKYGYTNTLGGISHMFDKEFWNYAKLISGVLRNGMNIIDVVNLVNGLELDSETINTWKNGIERALKRFIPDGTADNTGTKCPECGATSLVYEEGCLVCKSCGHSKCS
jgi:ribonucleoside-diphosphate reductase alpha chain